MMILLWLSVLISTLLVKSAITPQCGFGFDNPSLISWEYPKVCVNLQTDVR